MPHIAATTNDTCSTRSPLLSLSLLSNNHIGHSHGHIASVTSIVHQELPSPSRLNRRSSTCDPFFHPKCIHLWCHPAKNGHTSKLRYVACLIYNSDPNALNPSTKRSFSSSSFSSPPSPNRTMEGLDRGVTEPRCFKALRNPSEGLKRQKASLYFELLP